MDGRAGLRKAEMIEAKGEYAVVDLAGMDARNPLCESVRQHYLFAGLDESRFDSLAAHMSPRHMDKGDVLFHRGDAAEHFYFVDTGHIELSLISPAGEKKIIEVIGPGRTFAEAVAFMHGQKFPVTAEAIEASSLCQISSRDYMELLFANPDACLRLLSDVCRHLHARVREIENLSMQNARGRLLSYLLDHVTDIDDDEATIRLELPRHVIAARLSMQPETLSRLLRNFTDEGLLTIEDRVMFVHSLSRLRPYD